jgi:hypothetical protein
MLRTRLNLQAKIEFLIRKDSARQLAPARNGSWDEVRIFVLKELNSCLSDSGFKCVLMSRLEIDLLGDHVSDDVVWQARQIVGILLDAGVSVSRHHLNQVLDSIASDCLHMEEALGAVAATEVLMNLQRAHTRPERKIVSEARKAQNRKRWVETVQEKLWHNLEMELIEEGLQERDSIEPHLRAEERRRRCSRFARALDLLFCCCFHVRCGGSLGENQSFCPCMHRNRVSYLGLFLMLLGLLECLGLVIALAQSDYEQALSEKMPFLVAPGLAVISMGQVLFWCKKYLFVRLILVHVVLMLSLFLLWEGLACWIFHNYGALIEKLAFLAIPGLVMTCAVGIRLYLLEPGEALI